MPAATPARRLRARNVLTALGWWSLALPAAGFGLWLTAVYPAAEPWWLDRAGLGWAAAQRSALLDVLFAGVTWAGSLYLLGPLAAALLFGLLWWGRGCDGLLLALGLGGAALASNFLKAFIERERPSLYPLVATLPADGSFPSGHAIQAAAFALGLFLLAGRRGWPLRPLLAALLGALVAAVALSRVYLQVHYPSDVLAGLVLGAAWVLGLEQLAPGLGLAPAAEPGARPAPSTEA
jgi:undecaprenyl-diphosphatase